MRLLVLAPRFPYPLDKGDRLTVFNLLKHFARRHRVALVSFLEPGQHPGDRRHVEPWVDALYTVPLSRVNAYWNCVVGAFSTRPLQTSYYLSDRMSGLVDRAVAEFEPDLIYAHTIRMAPYLEHHRSRPTVLAMQIAMTLNYGRLARFSRHPLWKVLYGLEHRRVKTYEPEVARRCDRCLLISEADVGAISAEGRLDNVFLSPHGVDFEFFRPDGRGPREEGRLLFTGNMAYRPNVDAVRYFCRDILPLVKRRAPHVRLSIVGTNPVRAVRVLARDPAVEVTGWVSDLRTVLNGAEVGVDPLRIGAGLQNKVLEGMAMALPMVITSTANEGIGAVPGKHVWVADEPQAFADAVAHLLEDGDLRRKMGEAARAFIVEHWSWDKHFSALEEELESLVRAAGRR